MNKSLGEADRKILAELIVNCRQPLGAIAAKARMTKQNAALRIKMMAKLGYINSFVTLIDSEKAGYTTYYFNFRIKPISERKERAIMKELLGLDLVALFRCEGEWNLIIGIAAKDVDMLAAQSLRIHYILRGLLLSAQWTAHLSTITLSKPMYPDSSRSPQIVLGASKEKDELDGKDLMILSALSANARATFMEISKKSGIPPETVRYRQKLLEKKGIIAGYTISLGTDLQGFRHYRVFINLGKPTIENVERVVSFLINFRQTRRVVRLMSEFELMYDIRVSGEEEARAIMQSVARKFHNILSTQVYVRITKEYRFSHFPPICRV